MKADGKIQELSLLGGPLQRLGCRLGLVRGGTNTMMLGVALGVLPWGILTLLALLQGFGPKLFSLAAAGVHVRFLAAIPLFFLCETWIVPQMAEFARYIVRSGLVPEASLPAVASAIQRVLRMQDSSLPESLLFAAAFALPLIEMLASVPPGTGSWATILDSVGGKPTWIHGWYLGFCLPLFRFLMLRWLWRLGLWWYFLWNVQKTGLRLTATHSDGVGGLGYLGFVHEQFTPLVLAISALFSAQFAEDISEGTMAFETLYLWVPVVLLLAATLFIGPLVIFSGQLWLCRWTGMSRYMGMASRYVTAFESKWIPEGTACGESQLGSADLRSLADLTHSVNVVRGMLSIPVSPRLVTALAASAILPQLPLLLLKYPIDHVATRLFHALTGF